MVRHAYARSLPILEDLQRYVRSTLEPFASKNQYFFFERIKRFDSLLEKIETGRYDSWSEIDDLYACTVVVPVESHEPRVLEKLRSVFDEIEVKSRESTEKHPEVFRYDGLRWYGRVSDAATFSRARGIDKVVFEVQVRTAFEHAWQLVTHDLVYKSDSVEWSRLRLAAQLKAAVEQIETLIGAFEPAAGAVRSSPWGLGEAQQRVIVAFRRLVDDGLIPGSLKPASWRRFAESFVGMALKEPMTNSRQTRVDAAIELVQMNLERSDGIPIALSGTLMQYAYAVLADAGYTKTYRSRPVPYVREMRDLYDISSQSREFVFDGVSEVVREVDM